MGSETTAITLMFFIVATSIAAGSAAIMGNTIMAFSQGVSHRSAQVGSMLQTDVTIINDPNRVAVNPTILYVKNVGPRMLEPTSLTVLIDGRYVNYTAVIQNGAPRWATGDVVRLTISTSEMTITPGDHTVRITTDVATTSVFQFRST